MSNGGRHLALLGQRKEKFGCLLGDEEWVCRGKAVVSWRKRGYWPGPKQTLGCLGTSGM